MLAGGTGVTPMYQVANAILKNPSDKTQITLLFANVGADDILIENELTNLQALSPQFKVRWQRLAAKLNHANMHTNDTVKLSARCCGKGNAWHRCSLAAVSHCHHHYLEIDIRIQD